MKKTKKVQRATSEDRALGELKKSGWNKIVICGYHGPAFTIISNDLSDAEVVGITETARVKTVVDVCGGGRLQLPADWKLCDDFKK